MSAWEKFPMTRAEPEYSVADMFPMNGVSAETGGTPSVDRDTFRTVMGSFASGVCVVTTLDRAGLPKGFTCSAVCSVSAEPPLLLASVSNHSSSLSAAVAQGRFAVNILDRRARWIAQVFASLVKEKFERVPWRRGRAGGMPVLADIVAYAECELDRAVPAGDHTLLLGRLVGGGLGPDHRPLTYWRGGYVEVLG